MPLIADYAAVALLLAVVKYSAGIERRSVKAENPRKIRLQIDNPSSEREVSSFLQPQLNIENTSRIQLCVGSS